MSNVKLKSGRVIEMPSAAEDRAIKRGIAADPDSRELDDAFFAQARPATEVLGEGVVAALEKKRGRGRPSGSVAAQTKAQVTLRLDNDVLQALKATGRGWQSRINAMLRKDIEAGRLLSE